MANRIHAFLQEFEKQLRARGVFSTDRLAEIENHLLESMEANLRRGLSQVEAETEALNRFGSAAVVASTFENKRITYMQKILIGIAALAGLFSLYVDTRPNWDDTGVLAGGILLVSGLIALIGYQRPWLLALAVGVWIPLHGLLISHNYGSIIALIIAFVGSYAGWAFRLGIRKTFKIA